MLMRKSSEFFNFAHVPVKIRTLLSAVALFSSILGTQASADYVYDFQNYPSQQSGYQLSGQIVTNTNTSGPLAPGDIVSWSWTVSGGGLSSPITLTSSDSNAQVQIEGTVDLSPASITIAQPPKPSNFGDVNANSITFVDSLTSTNLGYSRQSDGDGLDVDSYFASSGTTLWETAGGNIPLGGTDPWLIATAAEATPEPAPITLLASGFFAIGGFGIYRRRCGRAAEPTQAN
jgi:hypothetical protein